MTGDGNVPSDGERGGEAGAGGAKTNAGETLTLSRADIDALDRRHRTNLVNCLSGFKGVNLLGTADRQGRTNLAIMSSTFHVGAAPPLIGLVLRPHSVPRHSLENLLETGDYTLNHVDRSMVERAHRTSARWPREVSEFDACGFTAEYTDAVAAPYVAESPVRIALSLAERHTLLNETVLLIGEMRELRLREDRRADDGQLDLAALEVVTACGLDEYHETRRLIRLPYAKAD